MKKLFGFILVLIDVVALIAALVYVMGWVWAVITLLIGFASAATLMAGLNLLMEE